MTIEEEFYKTFGVEPIRICKYNGETPIPICIKYPPITDTILLELVCIKSKDNNGYRISANNSKLLREDILNDLMKTYSTYLMCTWEEERAEKLKHQVQALFKG